MELPPMPWRILVIATFVGVLGGGIWGFVRGLYHLPTVPFAVVEGAILFGVPAALVGLVATGLWSLGSAACRRSA